MFLTQLHLQNFYIQGIKKRKHESYSYYGECLSDADNAEDKDFEM